MKKCREDIYHFLNIENGQIAIYDAVNPISSGRKALAKEFAKNDVQVGPRYLDLQCLQAECYYIPTHVDHLALLPLRTPQVQYLTVSRLFS